jgi:chemotaxis protein methyltransferase CheR
VISLKPEDQKALARYVYSITGIALDDSKGYLLEGRLGSLVEELGCNSYGDLVTRAQSEAGGVLRHRIIDAITTGETLFFRDAAPFELLRHKILPELVDRRTRPGRKTLIRIWSAACSTGQEVYSAAIVLRETLLHLERFEVRLLGTDISDQAIAKASRGLYSEIEISRGLNDEKLSRYFVKAGDQWRIRDEIRAMATFRTINLMSDFSALGRFDIIFCRNVAIYFNDRDRIGLFSRLEHALERDGYLVIGAMESLNTICPQLEPKRHLRSIYYQCRATPAPAGR